MTPRRPSKPRPKYLHGYSPEEQERLYKQAQFLEASVYEKLDFARERKIIEVGSGVGAQTAILLKRFPHLFVQGVDASESQIARAKQFLKKPIKEGRAAFDVADAAKLPYADYSFDGAFICWFLEHLQDPVSILREVRRVLRPEGTVYCNECLNSSFFVDPYSPATLKYWFEHNDHQWNLGGDPFVGAKLANYLLAAGFQNVKTNVVIHHYDDRTPKKRSQYIEYWTSLLVSGAPELERAGKVTPELVKEMKSELSAVKDAKNAVFFDAWVQATAQAL